MGDVEDVLPPLGMIYETTPMAPIRIQHGLLPSPAFLPSISRLDCIQQLLYAGRLRVLLDSHPVS